MLKDALKNYMDTYINFYWEAFGKYPQVDAEMNEEPSACFSHRMNIQQQRSIRILS